METITNANQIAKEVKKFRNSLRKIAVKKEKRTWFYPSGKHECETLTLSASRQNIEVGFLDAGTRFIHFLRISDGSTSLYPQAEINFPTQNTRRVSGVFIKSHNEVTICTRGIFNAYRGRVPKHIVLGHFNNWLVEAEENNTITQLIEITSIGSTNSANDLYSFIEEVNRLKQLYRSDTSYLPTSGSIFNFTPEFEGDKQKKASKAVKYNYTHGPICNELADYLKSTHKNKVIFNDQHIDVGIKHPSSGKIEHIFEVKTKSFPSDQIYKAVGQLFTYNLLFANGNANLSLVLPKEYKTNKLESLLKQLNISTVYYSDGEFHFVKH